MKIAFRTIHLVISLLALLAASARAAEFPASGPTVPGEKACLRGKIACALKDAPVAVKRAIWAANQLGSKPYRYGGGHGSFVDHAYDCSGTVSLALGGAGLLSSPISSSEFRRFGQRGPARWITTPYIPGQEGWRPGWQISSRARTGFEARHPIGL